MEGGPWLLGLLLLCWLLLLLDHKLGLQVL